jgi:hypothetical protein
MGDLCKGGGNKPVEIIPGTPKDVAKLREELITRMKTGMKEGATRYNHPLSTGTNPMQTQGASLISNLMGSGNYAPREGSTMPHTEWGGGEWGSHIDNKEIVKRDRQPWIDRKKTIRTKDGTEIPGTSFDPNVGPTLAQGQPVGMGQGSPVGMQPPMSRGINPQQMMMMAELAKRKQRFGI